MCARSVNRPAPVPDQPDWTTADAAELYRLEAWSDGFFRVNERGHVAVQVEDDNVPSIDIMDVVEEARRRDVTFPLLLRFQDVLRSRVRRLNLAFKAATDEAGYGNAYRGVGIPDVIHSGEQAAEKVFAQLDAG